MHSKSTLMCAFRRVGLRHGSMLVWAADPNSEWEFRYRLI